MISLGNVVLKDKCLVLIGGLSGCTEDFSEQNTEVLKEQPKKLPRNHHDLFWLPASKTFAVLYLTPNYSSK